MDMESRTTADPPAKIEYVRLPDVMPADGTTACYDPFGNASDTGNVVINTNGINFIWARFVEPVKAGQYATMVVNNIPGIWVLGGTATEWDMSTKDPAIGEAIISLIEVERGPGVGKIACRNTYAADVYVAVGIGVPILPLSAVFF